MVHDMCVITNYLNELSEHHPILQIMSEVCDGLQAGFPLQLTVHPGNIGCQLLLKYINQIHTNPINRNGTQHKTQLRVGAKRG